MPSSAAAIDSSTAGSARHQATQPRAGLRLTTQTASSSTTMPNAPNSARPAAACSITGYSITPSSCTASSNADGWRRIRTTQRSGANAAIVQPKCLNSA